jgi:RNA recognition motif-containing protein
MSKKIYVGNMNYSTDEASLRELFGDFGSVLSAKVITDQMTGRSKGFGFVEMEGDSEAAAAINALNGKEYNGRNLKVNEAIDKPRRDRY